MTPSAGQEATYNDVDTYGGYRGALHVEVGDNWVITPQVMGQRTKVGGIFAYDPSLGDLKVATSIRKPRTTSGGQAALTIEGKISNLDVTYAGSYLKRDVDTRQDYTDYSYFYDTLAGYGAYWTDDAGNPVDPSQYIIGRDAYKKVSHEFRDLDAAGQPLPPHRRRVLSAPDPRHHPELQDRRHRQRHRVPGYSGTIWLTAEAGRPRLAPASARWPSTSPTS
jgi:iron complex outermembrane receptor protein